MLTEHQLSVLSLPCPFSLHVPGAVGTDSGPRDGGLYSWGRGEQLRPSIPAQPARWLCETPTRGPHQWKDMKVLLSHAFV